VIVDTRLRTPLTSRCLASGPVPTVIATTVRDARRREPFERRGVTVLTYPPLRGRGRRVRVPLTALLRDLARRFGVMSVLIEGGGELIAGALNERLVDRATWIVAPIVVGGRAAPGAVGGDGIARLDQAIQLKDPAVTRLGSDLVIDAAVVYPAVSRPRRQARDRSQRVGA